MLGSESGREETALPHHPEAWYSPSLHLLLPSLPSPSFLSSSPSLPSLPRLQRPLSFVHLGMGPTLIFFYEMLRLIPCEERSLHFFFFGGGGVGGGVTCRELIRNFTLILIRFALLKLIFI